jgi:hypothetical protein
MESDSVRKLCRNGEKWTPSSISHFALDVPICSDDLPSARDAAKLASKSHDSSNIVLVTEEELASLSSDDVTHAHYFPLVVAVAAYFVLEVRKPHPWLGSHLADHY